MSQYHHVDLAYIPKGKQDMVACSYVQGGPMALKGSETIRYNHPPNGNVQVELPIADTA